MKYILIFCLFLSSCSTIKTQFMIGVCTEENDRIEYYNENIINHNKYDLKIVINKHVYIKIGDVDF